MKIKNIVLVAVGLAVCATVAAFAPPGVTFSKEAYIYPSNPGVAATSSSALVDAGVGVFADAASFTAGTAANGLHYIDVHETTGLELHFSLNATISQTGTARVYRAIPTRSTRYGTANVQWTFRHICDVSLTASKQASNTSGDISDITKSGRWASVAVTASADAGVSTRALNGTTTNAAGSLFIDPICAPYIVVQTKIGTADDITVYASDWTRN